MGGLFAKPRHEFSCPGEEFEYEQFVVHNMIRRVIRSILKRSEKPEEILQSAESFEHFKTYTNMFRMFLNAHHHHEDDLIFIRAREFCGDPELMKAEEEEHRAVHGQLTLLAKLSASGEQTSAARIGDEETIDGIRKCMQALNDQMPAHLEREEHSLTGQFYKEHASDEKVKAMRDELFKMINASKEMPSLVMMAMMIYNLTENEKIFFWDRMPFFVRGFLFGRAVTTVPVDVWKQAEFGHFDDSGAATWKASVWSDDEFDFKPYSTNASNSEQAN